VEAGSAPEPRSGTARPGRVQGLVAFRIGNAVIEVIYKGREPRSLSRRQAIDGAYTAAVEVAATFTP
jgi:hypothetical protein